MENKMEKRYGLPTAISMFIGIVIGSGVFIKGGKVLSLTGGNMMEGLAVVGLVGVIIIVLITSIAEHPTQDALERDEVRLRPRVGSVSERLRAGLPLGIVGSWNASGPSRARRPPRTRGAVRAIGRSGSAGTSTVSRVRSTSRLSGLCRRHGH